MKRLLLFSIFVLTYSVVQLFLISINKTRININNRLEEISAGIPRDKKIKTRGEREKKGFSVVYIPEKFENKINVAGIKMRSEEFILMWVFVAFAPAFLFYTISESIIRSIALILVGVIGPPFYIRMAIKKRQKQFEKQLGDSLQVLANGLRSGFSFQQALEYLAKDMPDPLGSEFRLAGREIMLGIDVETSLNKISERMKSEDMKLIATAVAIQHQVGGNLAEILDIISQTIRDRLNIRRSIRTLTAQGRISGQIVGFIPVVLLLIISIISPDYTEIFFTTPLGYMMLAVSLFLEVIGFLVINKIVNIKF